MYDWKPSRLTYPAILFNGSSLHSLPNDVPYHIGMPLTFPNELLIAGLCLFATLPTTGFKRARHAERVGLLEVPSANQSRPLGRVVWLRYICNIRTRVPSPTKVCCLVNVWLT